MTASAKELGGKCATGGGSGGGRTSGLSAGGGGRASSAVLGTGVGLFKGVTVGGGWSKEVEKTVVT
jgi:hypothetical protein